MGILYNGSGGYRSMTIRETYVGAPRHRQQVRTFALIWAGLTLLIGAATFAVIYAATGLANTNTQTAAPSGITVQENVVPVNNTNNTTNNNLGNGQPLAAVAAQVTATLVPTSGAPATNTKPADAAAQATTEPPTAAPPAGPTATIIPVQDKDFDLGIAIQEGFDAGAAGTWVAMASDQLKLNWVKIQLVWRDMEQQKGQIDFGLPDLNIPLYYKANTRIMLSIAKAPDWARDKNAIIKHGSYDGPPANNQDFVDFLNALLRRYPGMIHAVEVWNEINLDREWAVYPQKLDPTRYVNLLKTARDTIKAIDPNIIVISAALSPTGNGDGIRWQDDFIYFKQLLDAGMLQYTDCVGAHHNGINVPPTADFNNVPPRPKAKFRGPWENPHHSWAFKTTLEGYHNRIVQAGGTTKICVTEFGWPSVEGLNGQPRQGFEFAGDNSLQEQADFVDQAVTEMQNWGWIQLAFLWNLNYGAQAGWSMDGPVSDNVVYSILGPGFQPRPVWQKIADRNFRGQPRKASQ
jgi:hypothetical protein